jgi:hypothetical protein
MTLPVSEWRKLILQFFVGGGKFHFVCPKERLFEEFASHKDEHLLAAFKQLVEEGKLSVYPLNGRMLYGWNISKIQEINDEIFRTRENLADDIIQPFDKNLSDPNLKPEFESETDRNLPNKGKYYHFTKVQDNSFWVTIVKTKGSKNSSRLVLGTLSNPECRLCKIRKSIFRITKNTGKDTFIKKQVEDDEPGACGNTRQYSRAALDILKELGCIIEVNSRGRSPIYAITDKIFLNEESFRRKVTNQITWDEIVNTDYVSRDKKVISD